MARSTVWGATWLAFAPLVGCNALLGMDTLEPSVADQSETSAGGMSAAVAGRFSFVGGAGASVSGVGGVGGRAGSSSGVTVDGRSGSGGEPSTPAGDGGASAAGEAGVAALAGAGPEPTPSCPLPNDLVSEKPVFPLKNSCWRSAASDCGVEYAAGEGPHFALDDKLETRFSTGVYMEPGTSFEYRVDLRSVVDVTRVVLKSMANDGARELSVLVSEDGARWRSVACGSGSVVTDFWFDSVPARYVRFVQGGSAPSWWSIHELVIYGDGVDTCKGYVGVRVPGECDQVHQPG